jgi:hypothetical protein
VLSLARLQHDLCNRLSRALLFLRARIRLNIQIPVVLLGLVFLALQVDALGNFFHMYGRQFGPMQYDEFAHMMVQVLVSPIIVWLPDACCNKSVIDCRSNSLLFAGYDRVQPVGDLRDHRAVG